MNPDKHSYQLDFMAIDYCEYNLKFTQEFFKSNKNFALLSDFKIEDQMFYACERVDIALQIHEYQKEKIISEKLYDYYKKIEICRCYRKRQMGQKNYKSFKTSLINQVYNWQKF